MWEVFLLCTSNEDAEWRLREEEEGVPRGRQLFDERTPLLSPVVIYGSAPRSHKTRVSKDINLF